jgi:hypothetical protein
MKHILQPDEKTCGVAAIAMSTSRSLGEVREAMDWDTAKYDYTSLAMMLRNALRQQAPTP